MPKTGPTVSVPLSEAHARLLHAMRAALYREQLYQAPPGIAEVCRYALEQLGQLVLSAEELNRFVWENGRLIGLSVDEPKKPKGRKSR